MTLAFQVESAITTDGPGDAVIAGVTGVILAGGASSRMGSNKALLPYRGGVFVEAIFRQLRRLFPEVLLVTNSPEQYQFLPCRKVPDIFPGHGALAGIHAGLHHSYTDAIFVVACDMPYLNPALIRAVAAPPGGLNDAATGRLNDAARGPLSDANTGSLSDAATGPLGDANTGRLTDANTGRLNDADTGVVCDAATGGLSDADTGGRSVAVGRSVPPFAKGGQGGFAFHHAAADVVMPRSESGLEPLHALYRKACLPAIESSLLQGRRRIISFLPLVKVHEIPPAVVALLDPGCTSFSNINTPDQYHQLREAEKRPATELPIAVHPASLTNSL
jgi:molybdopterin-guanine dinucleotide biosynthesis protein A